MTVWAAGRGDETSTGFKTVHMVSKMSSIKRSFQRESENSPLRKRPRQSNHEEENGYSSDEDVPPEGTRIDSSQVDVSPELTQNLGVAEEDEQLGAAVKLFHFIKLIDSSFL